MLVTCLKRVGFLQRDVTPYRSPGCAEVLRRARADVTDFSYMTLMDTSVLKHNMLKGTALGSNCDKTHTQQPRI